MNAVSPVPVPRRRRWLLAVLLGSIALAGVVVAAAAINLFTLNRDAVVLRDEVCSAFHGRGSTRVQISAGPGTLMLLRAGLHFVDDAPPEARLALRAIRAASVGVYTMQQRPADREVIAVMDAADRRMVRRGWERIVGVNNARATVLIYMPVKSREHGTQRFCLAVCNDHDLVIVAGAVDPDHLVDLVRSKDLVAAMR